MDLTLLAILLIFGAGLLMGRKHPMILASAVFLLVGVLGAGTGAGEFVHTLLSDVYGFVT